MWNKLEHTGPLLAGEQGALRQAFARVIDASDDHWLCYHAPGLFRYVQQEAEALGLEQSTVGFAFVSEAASDPEDAYMVTLLRRLAKDLGSAEPPPATPLDQRLDELATALNLEPLDRAIIGVFARVSVMKAWKVLQVCNGKHYRLAPSTVAHVIAAL